jgi:hypothetical protein
METKAAFVWSERRVVLGRHVYDHGYDAMYKNSIPAHDTLYLLVVALGRLPRRHGIERYVRVSEQRRGPSGMTDLHGGKSLSCALARARPARTRALTGGPCLRVRLGAKEETEGRSRRKKGS